MTHSVWQARYDEPAQWYERTKQRLDELQALIVEKQARQDKIACGTKSRKFPHEPVITGVDRETAEQDACRIEHAVSDTASRKLKEKIQGTD